MKTLLLRGLWDPPPSLPADLYNAKLEHQDTKRTKRETIKWFQEIAKKMDVSDEESQAKEWWNKERTSRQGNINRLRRRLSLDDYICTRMELCTTHNYLYYPKCRSRESKYYSQRRCWECKMDREEMLGEQQDMADKKE